MIRKISFAIPAHNEELLIARTVAACIEAGKASGCEFEVVVACDACTDKTAEVAIAAGARVTECEKRIIAGSRNAAAAAASGDVLIFVDADTAPPAASVREALEAIHSGAVGGGGSVTCDGEIPPGLAIALKALTALFRMLSLTGGCFLFCTRTAFDAAGRWDETYFAGEEIELARALKQQGRFVIVQTPVLTSGRKLRTYSGWEIFKLSLVTILRPSARRDRSKLDLWYGPRREDPHDVSKNPRNMFPDGKK